MGVGIAIGGSALLGAYMGSQSAQAAGDAEQSKADQANYTRQIVMGESKAYQSDLISLSQQSPQQLNLLGQAYASSSANLAQQQKLFDAINPSVMEASQQALSLLRGGQAQANAPLVQLRNAQRTNLMNSLRSQYGPGAESSSVGQRALQQFDMQTNSMYQQNQQSSLNQLMGVAGTDAGARLQRATSGVEEVQQGYASMQQSQIAAHQNLESTELGALAGTSAAVINTAGAQYVGQALQGQAIGNAATNAGNAGLQYYMYSHPRSPSGSPGNTNNYNYYTGGGNSGTGYSSAGGDENYSGGYA